MSMEFPFSKKEKKMTSHGQTEAVALPGLVHFLTMLGQGTLRHDIEHNDILHDDIFAK
jgi:hypothetical protein